MEEEVIHVVAADVDEEEELSKVFKFVNLLWLHGLIDGENLEAARKISSHQGCHEHEVSCGGEADLHRHYTRCQKNPGHSQFIPARDFKIEHLPSDYRDNDVFEMIRSESDTTCRLLMKCTSANRPKYHPTRKHLLYPFSHLRDRKFMRTGTGTMSRVTRYTEDDNKNCECDGCSGPSTHTPHRVWGKVDIVTATHVVFDNDEARLTTCHFGYDKKTTLLHKCLKLTGLRIAETNIDGDVSVITYVTHDMDIINKLDKMSRHAQDLFDKVVSKYSYNEDYSPTALCPVVIISHPHGCSKHITVGMMTHRQTWSETEKHKEEGVEYNMVNASYTYNTHTCPGSSGAPVFRLPKRGKWLQFTSIHHSEAGEGNTNNKSVVVPEVVSFRLV